MRALASLAVGCLPATARAHGFVERYDLPVPLPWFIAGAAATVALTLLVAILFARRAPVSGASAAVAPVSFPRTLRIVCQIASVSVFLLTLAAALWGTGDPMMNLAPTLVLIVWWVGLALAVACIGNFWPAIDPWRAM